MYLVVLLGVLLGVLDGVLLVNGGGGGGGDCTEMALHYQMSEVLHELDIGMATNDLKVLLPTLNTATSLGMESSTNLHVVSYAVGCV